MTKVPIQTLAEFRADKGLTQRALAGKLGIQPTYISLYETGKQEVSAAIKEEFQAQFPGYNVLEMELSDEDMAATKQGRTPTTAVKYKFFTTKDKSEVKPDPEPRLQPEPKPEPEPAEPSSRTVHVLRQEGGKAYVYMTKAQAVDDLAEIILSDPEAYGWSIDQAEMR